MDENGILEELAKALDSTDTPAWARPILRCLWLDHQKLQQHLDWHAGVADTTRKIGLAILSAIGVSIVTWLLTGGAASVFK